MAVSVVWLSLGLPAVFVMGNYAPAALSDAGVVVGSGEIVVLEPKKWIGRRFPLLNYTSIGDRLREGDWRVLLYHHDCPNCQEAIATLRADVARAGNVQLALIEIPPYGERASGVFNSRPPIEGRLKAIKEWFVQTPVVLRLDDGRVVEVN